MPRQQSYDQLLREKNYHYRANQDKARTITNLNEQLDYLKYSKEKLEKENHDLETNLKAEQESCQKLRAAMDTLLSRNKDLLHKNNQLQCDKDKLKSQLSSSEKQLSSTKSELNEMSTKKNTLKELILDLAKGNSDDEPVSKKLKTNCFKKE